MNIKDLVDRSREFHGDWIKSGSSIKEPLANYFHPSGYMCSIGCNLQKATLQKLIEIGYQACKVRTLGKLGLSDPLVEEIKKNETFLKQAQYLQRLHDDSFTIVEYLIELNRWEASKFTIEE